VEKPELIILVPFILGSEITPPWQVELHKVFLLGQMNSGPVGENFSPEI